MRERAFAALFAAALAVPQCAHAGAWTPDQGQWQTITTVIASRASKSYDAKSQASQAIKFDKFFFQSSTEYGLTDDVTLFFAPETVIAQVNAPGARPIAVRNAAYEGGVRILLSAKIGMLSLQGSLKSAGAFDLSYSAGQASARQAELRLLYGTNFRLLGEDGFADVEAAERWISRPYPNETAIDTSVGVWLMPRTLILAQNFNVISDGSAKAPYTYYRFHKIELSVVQKLWKDWSVQLGGFVSPAGQNALVEQGVSVALWTRF